MKRSFFLSLTRLDDNIFAWSCDTTRTLQSCHLFLCYVSMSRFGKNIVFLRHGCWWPRLSTASTTGKFSSEPGPCFGCVRKYYVISWYLQNRLCMNWRSRAKPGLSTKMHPFLFLQHLNIFPASVCLEFIISFFFSFYSSTLSLSHWFFFPPFFSACSLCCFLYCCPSCLCLTLSVSCDLSSGRQGSANSRVRVSSFLLSTPSLLSLSLVLSLSYTLSVCSPSTINHHPIPASCFPFSPDALSFSRSLFNVLQMLFLALFSFSGTFSHPLPFIHSIPKRWIPPGARHWAT